MEALAAFPFLRDASLFPALSGALIPLPGRPRIKPVPGVLATGMLIGPYGIVALRDL